MPFKGDFEKCGKTVWNSGRFDGKKESEPERIVYWYRYIKMLSYKTDGIPCAGHVPTVNPEGPADDTDSPLAEQARSLETVC